ncbi:acyl-CoA N-acyltransferase [Xylariomycetidae sp. FL2044]|nr:acyl-CoA N-acyltransferase [Xylariomycetidae sp. FL2044]
MSLLPFPSPRSLAPSFVMSPGVPDDPDADAMADIYYDAFRTNWGLTYWWPAERDHILTWMRRRIRRKLADPRARHYKVSDAGTGELVAWARWDIPAGHEHDFPSPSAGADLDTPVEHGEGKGENTARSADTGDAGAPEQKPAPAQMSCPEGTDPEMMREFFRRLGVMQEKWGANDMLGRFSLSLSPFFFVTSARSNFSKTNTSLLLRIGLSLLCTAPRYHRRGIGRALLEPILQAADRIGLRTYLEASPAGVPLYEKLGFGVVDVIAYDLSELTSRYEGVHHLQVMIREPGKRVY